MPRQPRLDAPGTLHRVMGRGIDGIKIFRNRKDREDFLERLADLCRADALCVYEGGRSSDISVEIGILI